MSTNSDPSVAAKTSVASNTTAKPEAKHHRMDGAHESFSYPTSPDTRGSTRVRTSKKHYYFGPHNSAESYILFGLWKHRHETEGVIPEAKTLRPLVKQILESRADAEIVYARRSRARMLVVAAMVACIACGSVTTFLAVRKTSTPTVAKVDGKELSEREVVWVQSLRKSEEARIARLQSPDFAQRTAALFVELRTEGTLNPRHVSAKYPLPTP